MSVCLCWCFAFVGIVTNKDYSQIYLIFAGTTGKLNMKTGWLKLYGMIV